MPKTAVNAFYQNLLDNLSQKTFLRSAQITKRALLLMLREEDFKNRIQQFDTGEPVTAAAVLSLCLPVMARFAKEPEQGWLPQIYHDIVEQLFPSEPPEETEPGRMRAEFFYLLTYRTFLQAEEAKAAFDPLSHFRLAGGKELEQSQQREAYGRFLQLLDRSFVLELLHIGREVMPFNTLGHIAGVHHVAMHVARQLCKTETPVDLPLVSAAALSHDIGKFGCKGDETKRIPYLHYYYTDEWLKRYDLDGIAHIAANHSTWDLELENLSVESLLLIYADFRVKSTKSDNGREQIKIYTLDESYSVILSKLDQVDDKKKRRYERVYRKLHDFEDYMVSLGVNTDPACDIQNAPVTKTPALMTAQEAVQGLKFSAIRENLSLMRRVSSETAFVDMLEAARTEKDWKHIRAYINILEEYFTYMTQRQKLITMRFLYELFMHNQGDIRRQAAALLGNILTHYDVEYRKELPRHARPAPVGKTSADLWAEYIEMILNPDHKVTAKHRVWIGYTLKIILQSILQNCKPEEAERYLAPYFACFSQERYRAEAYPFVLLDSMTMVPLQYLTEETLAAPFAMAEYVMAHTKERRNHAVALRFLQHALQEPTVRRQMGGQAQRILSLLPEKDNVSMVYMLYRIYELLPGAEKQVEACEKALLRFDYSGLFLENLKTATPWIMKEINIELLVFHLETQDSTKALQIATHLANLVRVSERITVRRAAGEALIEIAERLTLEQRNEIAVELTKGLETAEYEFSKYIPQYLGRFALYLHPKEMDEIIDEFQKYIKSANERAACVTMPTLGVLLLHYDEAYQARFGECDETFTARRNRMLGLLLSGLAHFNEAVCQEAFLVIGKQLFGSSLAYERKRAMFKRIHKKLLTLLCEQQQDTLTFFNSAASLNHIYRFITNATVRFGDFRFPESAGVAFFPGTFDPFSSSHKGIVQAIRDLGLTVYLAVDEFSWSKNTQPHGVRRRIVNMSVADECGVFLFPDDIPVNLSNPADLSLLQAQFPGQKLYIVTGSDVILNASSYQKPPEPNSIHHFAHVVFRRNMESGAWESQRDIIHARVQSEIIELSLPPYLEDVSSSRIRENVDYNRDISMLVDPVAQSYIYDNGLYLREPQYKEVLRSETISFTACSPKDAALYPKILEAALQMTEGDPQQLTEKIRKDLLHPGAYVMVMNDGQQGKPLGFACVYRTNAAELFREFNSVALSEYVRRHTSGKIAVLSGIYTADRSRRDIARLLLTETLARMLEQDYTYAIYHGTGGAYDEKLRLTLARQGFVPLPGAEAKDAVYIVDMRAPIALIEDVQQGIKAPLRNRPAVEAILENTHRSFAKAMSGLYPGRLVLSFHAGLLNHSLTQKIIHANGVENIPSGVRSLGEYMCVPYGKILRGVVVPNTVTKGLHAEKIYAPDAKSFTITEYPGYSSLMDQIKTIHSFRRPVILADDLLHKGYRLEVLDPLFKEAGLSVKKIIVGVLSGRGKDLMAVQERDVDCVYFIPNLRYWFVESMLYPFLGGDSVYRQDARRSLHTLPSLNQILPYSYPSFISGAGQDAVYRLSLTCLENARDILATLEQEHQKLFERNLTLNRLGEALLWPRVPDRGSLAYDGNLPPSAYVESDIEALLRIGGMMERKN